MTSVLTKAAPTVTGKSASRPPAALLRRVPRQERGRVRVEKLLDAAAAVIANTGVDAATTNAIAAQAETSVGSLYQFFPNKEAIVDALAARYNSELRRINDEAMSSDMMFAPLPELMNRVVTALLCFHEENPAYRHVYQATHRADGAPGDKEAELHKAVVHRVEAILVARAPNMDSQVMHLHATVAVLAVHALLGFAMTASVAMRDGIVSELKGLIVNYLSDAISGVTTHPPLGISVERSG
jgi:AcrR family transcriptional regulator